MTPDVARLRLSRVRARLAPAKSDAILLTDPLNIRWAAGVADSRWALVSRRTADVLPFALGVDLVREDIAGGWRVLPALTGPAPLRAALRRGGVARLAYEAGTLAAGAADRLRRDLKAEVVLIPTDGLVEELRAVKDVDEMPALRRAASIAGEVAAQVPWMVREGMTESALAAQLDVRMRLAGADGPAFDTIVLFGARTALPHGRPGARALRRGDLILADFGAVTRGYRSDMTRVWSFGRPRAEDAATYRRVFAAYLAGRAAVRPGRAVAAADAAARRALGSLEPLFMHSLGHGVGLAIHERPGIARSVQATFARGMVVTVEPGVYRPGRGGVRLEDMFVVTPRGVESLTGAPAPVLPVVPIS